MRSKSRTFSVIKQLTILSDYHDNYIYIISLSMICIVLPILILILFHTSLNHCLNHQENDVYDNYLLHKINQYSIYNQVQIKKLQVKTKI